MQEVRYRENHRHLVWLLLLVTAAALAQKFSTSLQYDRSLILEGQYWRLLTCHFTHTGWQHLFLNFAGAVLVFALFFRLYSSWSWLLGTMCCMIGISLSLLVFNPHLVWYRGLSGLLHGLLMMGLIGRIGKGDRAYWIGVLALIAKLAMEQMAGPAGKTIQLIHAPVITNAHLSGAVTGGMVACVLLLLSTRATVSVGAINLKAGLRVDCLSRWLRLGSNSLP